LVEMTFGSDVSYLARSISPFNGYKPSPVTLSYQSVASRQLSRPSLGGSPECLAAVTKAHADFQKMMATPQGRQETENKFRFCPGTLDNVTNQIYITIDGILLGTRIQYNDPTCTEDYCNIKKICQRLAKG
ncbi:Thymus-specific serine protease, partial [Perkinsus chesapeaki]